MSGIFRTSDFKTNEATPLRAQVRVEGLVSTGNEGKVERKGGEGVEGACISLLAS